jgi:hypothetical protein
VRLSIIDSDPGYDINIGQTYTVEVFVDGKEAKMCITADEEVGYALCLEADKDGKPFLDPNDQAKTKKITLLGDVKIVITKL